MHKDRNTSRPAAVAPQRAQAGAPKRTHESAERIAAAQEKLVATSYERAGSYFSVVVFGGYAGIFGIWQLASKHLSPLQSLWTAVLVLVSLSAFVMFEVFKTYRASRLLFKKMDLLQPRRVRTEPDAVLRELDELDQAQHERNGVYKWAWYAAFPIAVLGGLGAALILGYAFISQLARAACT